MELKEQANTTTLEDLTKSVNKEAKVLADLGEHTGLPFLLGVCVDRKPVSLVLLFHGEGTSTLTIHKATTQSKDVDLRA